MDAVQRVWNINEVVREVMRQSTADGATLANCARVSRAISELALEVLWEELTGFEPLCSILPKSVKSFRSVDEDTGLTIRHYVSTWLGGGTSPLTGFLGHTRTDRRR